MTEPEQMTHLCVSVRAWRVPGCAHARVRVREFDPRDMHLMRRRRLEIIAVPAHL